jgi:hypothetical protein
MTPKILKLLLRVLSALMLKYQKENKVEFLPNAKLKTVLMRSRAHAY